MRTSWRSIRVILLFVILTTAALQSISASVPGKPIATGIVQESFISPWDKTKQTYLLYDYRLAKTQESAEAPLLVIYLHGATAHEDQGMTAGIYQNGFGRLALELERREAIYVCPEYRGGSWMGPAADADVSEIITILKKRYRPKKILLMGGSMGGTSVLIYAARNPSNLDGGIALCPATDPAKMFPKFPGQFLQSYGGSPSEKPTLYQERSAMNHTAELATVPLAIIHGSVDSMIPVEHSRSLVSKLQKLGARIHYIEVNGGGHDTPLYAVNWRDCFDYVLQPTSKPAVLK